MTDTVVERNGLLVLLCAADGPKVSSDRDAVDLLAQAWPQQVDLVIVPAERFTEGFFTLSTRIAGEIMQKFVNYHKRLVVVGDITGHLERSSALRDLVFESNRGRHIWFMPDLAALDAHLEGLANRSRG